MIIMNSTRHRWNRYYCACANAVELVGHQNVIMHLPTEIHTATETQRTFFHSSVSAFCRRDRIHSYLICSSILCVSIVSFLFRSHSSFVGFRFHLNALPIELQRPAAGAPLLWGGQCIECAVVPCATANSNFYNWRDKYCILIKACVIDTQFICENNLFIVRLFMSRCRCRLWTIGFGVCFCLHSDHSTNWSHTHSRSLSETILNL